MKIIDSFIFYNELDLLEYRLSILNDLVDYFILVESHIHNVYTYCHSNGFFDNDKAL